MVSEEEALRIAREKASKGGLSLYLLALKGENKLGLINKIKADPEVKRFTVMREKAFNEIKNRGGKSTASVEENASGVVSRFHKKQAKDAKRAIKRKGSRR